MRESAAIGTSARGSHLIVGIKENRVLVWSSVPLRMISLLGTKDDVVDVCIVAVSRPDPGHLDSLGP